MRTKKLLIGLLGLFVMVIFFAMSTKSQKPEEPLKFEVIEIGKGGSQRWSPDGTKIGFMAGGWLCVANADGKGEIQKVAQIKINSLEWMSDSEFVFSEKEPWIIKEKGRGSKLRIKTVDLKGNIQLIREDSVAPGNKYVSYISTPRVLKDGTAGYYEIYEKPDGETRIFKIIKQGKLAPEIIEKQLCVLESPYPWGDIWVEQIDGTLKKKVTKGERKYGSPQLSPDNTKILAHHYGLGISVLDLEGNILADFSKDLPKVQPGQIADIISANWSPDSKRILYDVIVESEDTTYSREIFIANYDGGDKIKIPGIPGELVGAPGWSPDGTRILCRSESGKIFVIKIK